MVFQAGFDKRFKLGVPHTPLRQERMN